MPIRRLPEFLKWRSFYNTLIDKSISITDKNKFIDSSPKSFILSLEEICINLRNFNIVLSETQERTLIKSFKKILQKLANPKISVKAKKRLLKSPKGRKFLVDGLPLILAALEDIRIQYEQSKTHDSRTPK